MLHNETSVLLSAMPVGKTFTYKPAKFICLIYLCPLRVTSVCCDVTFVSVTLRPREMEQN